MRFEYSASTVDRWGMGGSCSLTHNVTTGKAEHLGACDDAGPPPLPCCGGLRGQHAQVLCEHRAIPHLFVISIEPDDVDPGMVDVRAFAYYQGAEGTLQALCLPSGAISQLGWYQLRPLTPAPAPIQVTEAINGPPGYIVRSCDPGHPAASAQLHAERQAVLQQDLGDLRTALAHLAQLDPTDPQQNELRVAQVAVASLWGTLHGLGLAASAETA